MANKKYNELISNVADYVGGKSNVVYFTHCATRLRFNLKDRELVNLKALRETPGVLGVQWSGEQLQLIIGTSAEEVFRSITSKHQLDGKATSNKNDEESSKKKFSINTVFDVISGSVAEVLPVLIGAGMINVVLVILNSVGVLSEENSTYAVLSFVSNTAFYFLPMFVGATSAKKFNMNMWIGMFFGAVLIHPTFISMVSEGTQGTIFGMPIYGVEYTSTFFPVLLTTFVASFIYKGITRICPDILKSMIVPLVTIIVTVPLMLVVLAPLGSIIGTFIASGLVWIYDKIGFLGLGILGAVYPWLVITGMQHSLGPYLFQSLAQYGYEAMLFPITYVSNINTGVAALAVGIKSKNTKRKSDAISSSITALLAGITEPALFGVNLRYRTPLYASMIGNFVGCCVAGLFNVVGYTFVGSFGILGLPAFIGDRPNNLLNIVIALLAGSVTTFAVVILLYKDTEENEEYENNEEASQEVITMETI